MDFFQSDYDNSNIRYENNKTGVLSVAVYNKNDKNNNSHRNSSSEIDDNDNDDNINTDNNNSDSDNSNDNATVNSYDNKQ